ncbi:hypothetical protein [Nocardia sp. CNY236]|uniref:hypothetical protein n=1 Tax=Nocardia sp. CNY236 TaxID=1169152 RepID=UPI00041171D4|nr:hypothetical protein [Nocardia sp. CNY236]
MTIEKLMATTLLTIAATGITAATASGRAEVSALTIGGVDRGVVYTATAAPDRSSATMTLASGTFVVTPNAAVSVLAPSGEVVATVPTTLRTATNEELRVAPTIDAAATTLTLTPVRSATPEPGAARFIGDTGSIVGGALLGCVLGGLVGIVVFFIGAVPGCVIGGLIGGIGGANQ